MQEIRLGALNRESNLLKTLRDLFTEIGDAIALAALASWAQEHRVALEQVYAASPEKPQEMISPRRRRGRPKKLPIPPKPARRVGFIAGIKPEENIA